MPNQAGENTELKFEYLATTQISPSDCAIEHLRMEASDLKLQTDWCME